MKTALIVKVTTLLVVSFVASPARGEQTIETVRKDLAQRMAKHKSIVIKHHMSHGIMGEVDTTTEIARKADGWVLRIESTGVMELEKGTRDKNHSIEIHDGKYVYRLNEHQNSQDPARTNTRATRRIARKEESGNPLDINQMFERLNRDFVLKMLPDDKIEGHPAYAIALLTKDNTPDAGTSSILYFDKETGAPIGMVVSNAANKPILKQRLTELKIDTPLEPARFVFKAPPGVKVTEETPAPQTDSSSNK